MNTNHLMVWEPAAATLLAEAYGALAATEVA